MSFVAVAARPLRRDPTPNSEIMTPSPLLFLALAALGGQDQPAPWFPKPAAPTPSAAPAAPTAPRAVATSLRLVDLALQDDRGYLGIYMEPTDRGLLVSGLMEGGAAEAAGIRAGDTITHVGAIKLSTPEGVEQLG
ncbi:MAG: PDZ domain-containing protein, partial [Planctomycetota bacterium]|nr:PDZ domain-containing protein [Planctomycetota bacterium]